MRFKVDENLPVDVAVRLRAAGHDAVTVAEQDMVGQVDPDLAETCRREDRVLVTLDLDFADIRAYPPEEYPGLIVLRLARHDKRRVMDVFDRVVPLLQREPLARRLWVVDEQQIRTRGRDESPAET